MMEQEKLNAIREYVNEYKLRLTGHWSENVPQMLHDLLEEHEKLLEVNKNLAYNCNSWMDKFDKSYDEHKKSKEEILKLVKENEELRKKLEYFKWVKEIKYEHIESVLSHSKYQLNKKDIEEILDKIIELHNF